MEEYNYINPEIVGKYCRKGEYGVTYYMYRETRNTPCRVANPLSEPNKFQKIQRIKSNCFAAVLRKLKEHKKDEWNRISYTAEIGNAPLELMLKEKQDWIRVCKEHNILPSYVPSASAKNMVFVIKLINCLPPSLLYCYLSCFRCLTELPDFVRAMLYLTRTKNMDFHAAWLVASMSCVPSSNKIHHIGEWGMNYICKEDDVNKKEINMYDVFNFYKYLHNPVKYDPRSLTPKNKNDYHTWDCASVIRQISKSTIDNCTVLSKNLFSDKLQGILEQETLTNEALIGLRND